MEKKMILALLGLLLIVVDVRCSYDETTTPETSGSAVVEQVERLIKENCIFPDDKLLMRRIAFVESGDGKHPDTYRDGYHGGIWQVDEAMFDETRKPEHDLATYIDLIHDVFGIDWTAISWEDLRRPLYSSLGARLYIITQAGQSSADVPRDIPGQAGFWRDHYRQGGDVDEFIEKADKLEAGCERRGSDIVFVIDQSGSIGSSNFIKVKRFIQGVVQAFDVRHDQNQFGLIKYSSSDRIISEFHMNTYYDKNEILEHVEYMRYNGGATRTDLALAMLVDQEMTPEHGARDRTEGFPRVAIVMTDGVSDYPAVTLTAAARAHAANITMIAIGVGHTISKDEIEAIASQPNCSHHFYLDGFDDIEQLKYAIERVTCDAPVIIGPDEGTSPEIPPGGNLPCKFMVNEDGTTVQIKSRQGAVHYTAARSTYPSSAYFEKDVRVAAGAQGSLFLPYLGEVHAEGGLSTWYCNIIGDPDNDTDLDIGNKPGKPDPCGDHGHCVCVCDEGWTGEHCDVEIDGACDPNPCDNGGSCEALFIEDPYVCHCIPPFSGTHCEEISFPRNLHI